jgi:uncharacterized protein (DUF305 family)
MRLNLSLSAFTAFALMAGMPGALSQEDSDAGSSPPEVCKSGGMDTMPAMEQGSMDMGKMDRAHQDLIKSMPEMSRNMRQGMMVKNVDVAFVCGMIAHHQGAIDMAKAELAHGKDAFAKEMAQKVIDAQTAEIAEMLAWLKKKSE